MKKKEPKPVTKHTIIYDWETYYSPKEKYTLKLLPPTQYIRDPRFKSHGVAVQLDNEPPVYYPGDSIKEAELPWDESLAVCHNALFDSLILTERFGIIPQAYADTQTLARALLQLPSYSLDYLATRLFGNQKLKDEGNESLVKIGQNLILSTEQQERLGEYCIHDVALCKKIFDLLWPHLPDLEKQVMSTTIRWFAEPRLHLDTALLEAEQARLATERKDLIAESGWQEGELSSNKLFVEKLQGQYSIEYPTKISPLTGKPTPATGKNDPEFIELQNEHPELKPVWEARKTVKSTLQKSRIETLLSIASLAPGEPTLPVPLNYWAAQTGRWSGAGKVNLQNLPQLNKSLLRRAIIAPPGHVIVVADSSQIELRTNLWFCNETELHDVLAGGQDLYKLAAANHFGIPIEEVTKTQRNFGKVLELALGYGQGPIKLRHLCASGPLGLDPIYISPEEAQRAVRTYRGTHRGIPETWRQLDSLIWEMTKKDADVTWRGLRIQHEKIQLPDGMLLQYTDLKQDADTQQWTYGPVKKRRGLYGAKLLENIIQALARSIIAKQLIDVEQAGIWTLSSTHDEILSLAKEEDAKETLNTMLNTMSKTPSWAEGLVLSAEGDYDKSYCK